MGILINCLQLKDEGITLSAFSKGIIASKLSGLLSILFL